MVYKISQKLQIKSTTLFLAPPAKAISVKDEALTTELQTHLDVSVLGFAKLYREFSDKLENPSSITVVLTEYIIGAPPEKVAAYVAAKAAKQSLYGARAWSIGCSLQRCRSRHDQYALQRWRSCAIKANRRSAQSVAPPMYT